MKRPFPRMIAAVLLLGLAIEACSSTTGAGGSAAVGPVTGDGRLPHTAADVQFMSGMIGHHAQAVLIAGWAPTHRASPSVGTLSERIVAGQLDEIALAQRWLRDRGETVPEADTSHVMMPGMDHSVHMAGMLTAQQLAQLDSARGPEFDRLFLTFMIQHHQGALTMVDQLFGSQGAGQDETVFRFASDVYADQSTEIDRMQKMLAALPPGGRSP